MARMRSERKTKAPFRTATTCRSSGKSRRISAASSATRFWICVFERVGFQTGAGRPWARHHTRAMKRFDIITETDARILARGETVMLARGGHITPLAAGHAAGAAGAGRRRGPGVGGRGRARAGGRHPDGGDRQRPHRRQAPPARSSTFLRGRGLAVQDLGTDGTGPGRLSRRRRRRSRARSPAARRTPGIVIDGAGIGSAIAANKMRGHPGGDGDDGDDRPVLAGAQRRERAHARARRWSRADEARAIVTTWLTTPMREPRYIRRLAKIRDLERSGIRDRDSIGQHDARRAPAPDRRRSSSELAAAAAPPRGAVRVSLGARRLLPGSPARRARRGRDARRRARRRAARRPASRR